MAAPQIVMHCPTVTCPNVGVDQTVDAGVLLNDAVLATYSNYSCTNCGSHMIVTGAAPS